MYWRRHTGKGFEENGLCHRYAPSPFIGATAREYTEWLHIGRLYAEDVWTANRVFTVVYTTGYGATRAATQALIPDAVTFVLQAVAFLYENRTASKSQSISGIGAIDYGELEGLPKALFRQLDSLIVGAKGLG